ncbi:fibroin heavy chain isoform X4 [Cynoglossus semilaevis]|uniref:fibroin heavy chain isoform X4 n=1 Tax=Cynoglossus semilaevis TaxID=244447 RepID=UPI000496BDD0|nr:fibroin heavy chain-like isoform X4 [Cynoglossus semilaevis]
MLAPALLQTTLVLWLVQQTLQGGVVKPQSVSWGKVLPARGVNVAMKPGVAGTLGALGNRFGTKAMKTGKLFDSVGRYPGAQLGVGGFRSLGLGSKAGLKQGMLPQGAYGASLGTGMPVGAGLTNGLGLGLGQAGRRVYGAGLGNLPGYGSVAGVGYPGARPGLGLGYPTGQRPEDQVPGYAGGAGNYLGASLGNGGYGAGLGQGGYLGAAAGKLGAHGQGLYPQGVPGYGDGAYLGAMGNGYGYGNGYSDGYGAGLGYPTELADRGVNKAGKREGFNAGAYGPVQGSYGTLGAGLESAGGKYAGGAGSYGNAPVIPAGLEGDGGYPYAAQPLSLNAEGAKSSSKFDAGVGFGPRQAGYGAHLGATQDALREQRGKYTGVNGALGNGYKA